MAGKVGAWRGCWGALGEDQLRGWERVGKGFLKGQDRASIPQLVT